MTLRTSCKAIVVAATLCAAAPVAAAITFTSDPTLYWNERMTTLFAGPAPVQARGFAMANIAMHDAINATLGNPNRSYLSGVGPSGGDTRAAASQAAYGVLTAVNAANASQYKIALDNSLSLVADGAAKDQGIATGKAYAAAIIAARSADGSSNPLAITYGPTGAPGNFSVPAGAMAVLPFWGSVDPFVMDSPSQLRAAAPPALGSAAYATAYAEVKAIGAVGSLTRTADQTASALFWDAANASPWMQIGLAVAEDENMSTIQLASTFGRLSTGLADALIAGFDSKYEYDFWRPQSAIRGGDANGNPGAGDAAWTSLFPAPLHPSYISTHSALSGGGSTILTSIFGDDEPFSLTICNMPAVPATCDTRSFTGLLNAAEDGANSRLWGGIHFRFDNEAGLAMGREVGRLSLAQPEFGAVPEPATWAMMIAGFASIGCALRRGRRQSAVARPC